MKSEDMPSAKDFDYAIRRLKKDAEICSKVRARDHYPPESLLKVASFLEDCNEQAKTGKNHAERVN